MGTWGAGVFENDTAEDLLEALAPMDSGGRERLLVSVLAPAGSVDPAEALAGVALVAVGISGNPVFSGAEDHPGMENWFRRDSLVGICGIALRVLQVMENESHQYWNGWIDEDDKAEALVDVARMKSMLSGG
ncbi:DUF4259 domain-containing protein [Nocardiopsis sp. NRRL B-16309]|uniref:DUF4259 domain-containing protein n=1 Tax=Nocardiopsis sp. NRRL B-16309 TaxID=1519494 RepID=UPI0009E89BED|nr:DUF4259 domain-containing protein [Nocardiopsis sp. NRRL B-16309]